ncbi:MAG: hypothetical protein LBR44_00005, partial [Clostridiales Family XIII bacterium]|nr:hypothetical protein [Clostridiales Family XIII bacterium]
YGCVLRPCQTAKQTIFRSKSLEASDSFCDTGKWHSRTGGTAKAVAEVTGRIRRFQTGEFGSHVVYHMEALITCQENFFTYIIREYECGLRGN